MTICITGASGFIGSHLSRALPGAKLFNYPLSDLRVLEDAEDFIYRYKPETVFHLAAQSVVTNNDRLESESVNIAGTYNLLNACLDNPNLKSIVHISTDKVYGTNANARRSDELRGVSHPYSASKICGDVLAQMYKNFHGLPIRIVRMANIYGPGDPHLDRIVPGIITDTLNGIRREHRGDPRWIRDFIYVGDLIPALIKISKEPPGIYNLGGDYCSLQYLAELIPHLMGRDDLKPIWNVNARNEIPFQHIVDCPDWWKPQTTLVDGLLKTIEYYKDLP